jgi:hypothetical protein
MNADDLLHAHAAPSPPDTNHDSGTSIFDRSYLTTLAAAHVQRNRKFTGCAGDYIFLMSVSERSVQRWLAGQPLPACDPVRPVLPQGAGCARHFRRCLLAVLIEIAHSHRLGSAAEAMFHDRRSVGEVKRIVHRGEPDEIAWVELAFAMFCRMPDPTLQSSFVTGPKTPVSRRWPSYSTRPARGSMQRSSWHPGRRAR